MTINTSGDLILSFFFWQQRERERETLNPKHAIQSGRGLGGVLRGIRKIASAALRGDVGPVLQSMVRKTLINYGKRKAKDFVFGKLTGVKRKEKVKKKRNERYKKEKKNSKTFE